MRNLNLTNFAVNVTDEFTAMVNVLRSYIHHTNMTTIQENNTPTQCTLNVELLHYASYCSRLKNDRRYERCHLIGGGGGGGGAGTASHHTAKLLHPTQKRVSPLLLLTSPQDKETLDMCAHTSIEHLLICDIVATAAVCAEPRNTAEIPLALQSS